MADKILLGSGAIYFDFGLATESLVGSTQGEGKFNRKVKYHDIERNGALGKEKGMSIKESVEITMSFGALNLIETNMTKFFAGLESKVVDTYTEITATEDLVLSDYIDNVAFVGTDKAGKEIIIMIENATGLGDLEMKFKDKEEIVADVELTATFDPLTPNCEPWKIKYLN
ncbi:hypothetical protein [Clostridium grantii]|uniref:Phage tail tube protein n=1 Tax=Clostridium grantii DSM 8605 TaxID=1121316 RepID=A0A1M5SDW3_9CLOT|nr:hypothetical protein [Clostridium grantii]SHH36113.1 hypothetical protein SAMN02745207_00862 [Clostridium grantii DSM 8605]